MRRLSALGPAALLASAFMAQTAAGAVGDAADSDLAGATGNAPFDAPIIEHQLDVEMTVRNWVLCASQAFAEELVHARQASSEAAVKAFADLQAARSCGRLAEMQVILHEPLYEALLGSGGSAKVYSALVKFAGTWASGFVVYGGLPDDRPR